MKRHTHAAALFAGLGLLLLTACSSGDASSDGAQSNPEPANQPSARVPGGDIAPGLPPDSISLLPAPAIAVAPAPPVDLPLVTPGRPAPRPGSVPGAGPIISDPNGPAVSGLAIDGPAVSGFAGGGSASGGSSFDPGTSVSSPPFEGLVPDGSLPSKPSASAPSFYGDPVPSGTAVPITAPPGTQLVEAPIDSLDIVVRESFPPQYGLQALAGLPSGCAKQAGYQTARNGTEIRVAVLNTLPTGAIACTMIYGMYEVNLNLGSDFTPGTTYTVFVNDKQTTFVAQ